MNEKITFSDLIDKIAEETGASKKLIHDLLIETKNITSEGLEHDGKMNISGLGNFDLKWHEARPGRNPQTGQEIEIPAHNTINFKATSDLREYINRKYANLKPEIIEEKEPGITAVPPVLPEPEPLKPEPAPEPEEQTSDKSYAWLWLIIPIIIIILAFLLWPFDKAPEPTQVKTMVDETKGKPSEPQKPIKKLDKAEPEKPQETFKATGQTDTPANNFKPESKKLLKPIKEPTPIKEESVAAEKESAPVKTEIGILGGTHSVQPGDNLWTIARDFYKQSYLWPNIYRVNLNKINNPDMLSIGDNVEIPSLQGKPGSLTEKDIKNIAKGFIETYLVYKELGKEKALYYLWVVNKWDAQKVIEKYKNRIDEADLKLVKKIEGEPVIR